MKRADAVETLRCSQRKPAVKDLSARLVAAFVAGEIPQGPLQHYPFYRSHGWFFDFAWPAQLVAVDVGNFTVLTPHEKWDFAQQAGWRVFRFSPKEVRDGKAVEILSRALAHPPLFKT